MSEPYTNLDLDTAEQLLIAAGHAEQAKAMRHHVEGIRNFIQGEFGQSFVDAFDRVVGKHSEPLLEGIAGLRMDVQQLAMESAARLGKLETRMDASEADRAELRERLERIEKIMAERPKQRKAEHQALLKAIRDGYADG